MKAKILGGYSFTSKTGNKCYNLTVQDNRENSVGLITRNLMAVKLPDTLENMVDKTYLIDTNGNFGSDFYLLK